MPKREAELAKVIADAVNPFGFNGYKFAEAMGRQHKYLQSEFFHKVIVPFIAYAASEEYDYDGRNEYVHETCKKISYNMKWYWKGEK